MTTDAARWRQPILAAVLAGLQAPEPTAQPLVDALRAANSDVALDDHIADAHAHLARAESDSVLAWRCLHTDACILGALLAPADAEAAISRLDTAIIVSGAAGEGRLDLVLDLIRRIQEEKWGAPPPFALPSPSAPEPDPQVPPLPLPRIPEHPAPYPSLAAFQSTAHAAPFILRSFASDWPALTSRPWASKAYLRAVAGPARLVPVEVGADYREEDWDTRLVRFEAFLESLDDVHIGAASNANKSTHTRAHTHRSAAPPLYLAQHSLLRQLPALRDDIDVPDYVYAALPRPPGCAPPANDEGLVVNVWMGPRGTVSPAHTDPYFNIFVQIAGYKTVWAAPPACAPGMYAGGGEGKGEGKMGNTSRVDVFAPDLAAFPRFAEVVLGGGAGSSVDAGASASSEDAEGTETSTGAGKAKPLSVTLGPGDVLYLPAGWWHAMRAESTSCSVSMWF